MDQVTILIIGIGIGYFWAMYRKDNIRVYSSVDAKKFFLELDHWIDRHDYKPGKVIPK